LEQVRQYIREQEAAGGNNGASETKKQARNARRLDPWSTAIEAAQLIKPPALRGVSDSSSERNKAADLPAMFSWSQRNRSH
jgi:hypothetical protein